MNRKDIFSRSELLLGHEVMERLSKARVIIFGVGGVGSWAAEALVRTGLIHLDLVDFDDVAPSNINRQMPALPATVGMKKVEVCRQRLLGINPQAQIRTFDMLYTPDTASSFDLNQYDYVVDAIDSLRDKMLLVNNATRSRATLFSSMGAALKTDPTKVSVAEFWKVEGCKLGAALRQRFKKSDMRPARKFKCVYSPELTPNRGTSAETLDGSPTGKVHVNGSLMPVTCTFGMTLASLVINDLSERVDELMR